MHYQYFIDFPFASQVLFVMNAGQWPSSRLLGWLKKGALWREPELKPSNWEVNAQLAHGMRFYGKLCVKLVKALNVHRTSLTSGCDFAIIRSVNFRKNAIYYICLIVTFRLLRDKYYWDIHISFHFSKRDCLLVPRYGPPIYPKGNHELPLECHDIKPSHSD